MKNESPAPIRPAVPLYGAIWHPRERTYSIFLHLSALAALLAAPLSSPLIYGFGAVLGPLIIWLIFRRKSDMVDFHGKKALSFQISMSIFWLFAYRLAATFFGAAGGLAFGIGEDPDSQGVDGFLLGFILAALAGGAILLTIVAVWLTWTIRAGVRASRGDPPGYILAIPLLR